LRNLFRVRTPELAHFAKLQLIKYNCGKSPFPATWGDIRTGVVEDGFAAIQRCRRRWGESIGFAKIARIAENAAFPFRSLPDQRKAILPILSL